MAAQTLEKRCNNDDAQAPDVEIKTLSELPELVGLR
jgi:hypothetical protein